MRGMRKLRENLPNRVYHLISRVAHRAFFLNAEERARFVELLKRVATFSGIELLAYYVMTNHVHILVFVPEPEELSDEEVLSRMRILYRDSRFAGAQARFAWGGRSRDDDRGLRRPQSREGGDRVRRRRACRLRVGKLS